MPVDRDEWFPAANPPMSTNVYFLLGGIQHSTSEIRSESIIWPGKCLHATPLRWKRHAILAFEIDKSSSPDVVGRCYDSPTLCDKQFDVVVARHALSHSPPWNHESSIAEITRGGGNVHIYLPIAGQHRGFQMSLGSCESANALDLSIPLFASLEERPSLRGGEQYGDVGYRGFNKRTVRSGLRSSTSAPAECRDSNWIPSYNFIFRSVA